MTQPRARAGAILTLVLAMTAPMLLAPADAALRQEGRVTYVVDGDTFDVDLDRDRKPDARIRLIGIDTPEMGTCGSEGAKRALRGLIDGRLVVLTADDGDANGIKGRLMRRASINTSNGRVDVTTWLLQRGWGPWMPRPNELTGNLAHHTAAAQAAAARRRYFDSDRCRSGPAQRNPIALFAQWQADPAPGKDVLYEEFIRITNGGQTGIDMDRWHLNMGGARDLVVPPGKPIAAGRTLTIHVGEGRNTRYHRFLNRQTPLLKKTDLDGGPHVGDGAYLLDRHWDLRAHMMWPCVGTCGHPAKGNLVISKVEWDPAGVHYPDEHRYEYVRFTNQGQSSIHTGSLVFDLHPYIYELPPAHRLAPGETLEIRVRRGTESSLVRYLGATKDNVLKNDGDRVLVRTFDGIVIDCVAWGSKACPS